MGAGASQPGAGGASGGATSATGAPNHHIAIGGLTGITHGAQRHVTWSLYHESGFHTIHLQHDGFTGRRLLQCDRQDIFYKKYSYSLFDSSSSHSFNLHTLALIDPKDLAAPTRPASAQPGNRSRPGTASSAASSSSSSSSGSQGRAAAPRTVVTVNIEEKDTYFLYTAQVDRCQYREYQSSFWKRAVIFALPVRDMASKKRNKAGVEEGIADDQHSVVVIHSPHFTVLVNGRPTDTASSFAADDALSHTFSLEPGVTAEYTLVPFSSHQTSAQPLRHARGLTVEGGTMGVLYAYRLTVDGQEVREMKWPPLLPPAWKDGAAPDAVRKDKLKHELDKTKHIEEHKEHDATAAATHAIADIRLDSK